jgi:hypothetical protein
MSLLSKSWNLNLGMLRAGILAAAALVAAAAQPSFAQETGFCSAGCSGLLNVTPGVITEGETVSFTPVASNVSETQPINGAGQVASDLECDFVDNSVVLPGDQGTCCLKLACEEGTDCLANPVNELPSTFTNTQCTATAAGVTSCDVIDDNTVCVAGTIPFAAGEAFKNLFTVEADAANPVLANNGTFTIRFNGPNSLVTNDAACSEGQVFGDCGSSANANFAPVCEVEVDKQVSCDGGLTWYDDDGSGTGANEYVTMNEDGTNAPCLGWNGEDVDGDGTPDGPGEEVLIRYRVRNTGDLQVTSCTATDSNQAIPAVVFPNGGALDIGAETDFFGPSDVLCSVDLSSREPNTLTIESCTCPVTQEPANGGVPPFDTADFECQTPGATFTKSCEDNEGADGNDDTVEINGMNVGSATLENCSISDVLDRGDPTPPCAEVPVGPTDQIPLTCLVNGQDVDEADFDLAPGDALSCTGDLPGDLAGTACNHAELNCDVAGAPVDPEKSGFTRFSEDVCTVLTCPTVTFDKQVDGGIGFVDCFDDDPDCLNDTDDSTDAEQPVQAIGWDDEGVNYRYVVDVVDGVGTSIECGLVDDVLGTIRDIETNPITGTETITEPAICGETITETGKTVEGINTATLSCRCIDAQTDQQITALDDEVDRADLECQAPSVAITKTCVECDQESGENAVDVSVTNDGEANLLGCQVMDVLENDDGACPSDDANTVPVDLTCNTASDGTGAAVPVPFDLATSQTVYCSGTVAGLEAERCNTATVECEIDDGTGSAVVAKTVDDRADDLCEPCVGEGCLHKTPGFWCTHPTVTNLFLDLEVCGIPINNVQVATQGSAIEDLRSPGKDHKLVSSPQRAQLIRQCTAAALNQAASAANEGSCESEPVGDSTFGAVFASCCDDLCANDASAGQINASGCIGLLDDFNNTPEDTFAEIPPPFDNLGNAFCPVPDGTDPELAPRCNGQPDRCNAAGGNGFVNTRLGAPTSSGRGNR